MKNYYLTIDGWAQYGGQGLLFKHLLSMYDTSNRLNIVEVGVYKGRMTALICDMLSESGIISDYHCVDHFLGSEEHERKDYYPEFEANILPLALAFEGVDITVHRDDSVVVASTFETASCDIVYIDASHDYESVKKDIEAWVRVVKPNGFLCGDDYMAGWPGVVKAVDEYFGKKNVSLIGGNQWYVRF